MEKIREAFRPAQATETQRTYKKRTLRR